jgi:hypothetical protein
MKRSIKGLFVILAIVMSFVLVQGVWAEKLVGTATTVANRAIGLDTDGDDETDVTVYHMGPPSYWIVEGLSYPKKGDNLSIEAYYSVSVTGYIGVEVCYQEGDCIPLRDPDTLKPLWTKIAETIDLSDTAAAATGDCEPNVYDQNYDYNWKDVDEPGPHGGKDS